MCIFAVIMAILKYVRMSPCVVIPLFPGPPMPVIGIPMPSIVVMSVMTTVVIGTLSVSSMIVVVRTIFVVLARWVIRMGFVVLPTLAIAIGIFGHCRNSRCNQKKRYKYCNHHFLHPTPPACVMVFAARWIRILIKHHLYLLVARKFKNRQVKSCKR